MPNFTKEQTEAGMKALSAHIAGLDVGDSYALARKLDADDATRDAMTTAMRQLENTARAGIARAKNALGDGAAFTGEQGNFRTSKTFDPIMVYVVTRNA